MIQAKADLRPEAQVITSKDGKASAKAKKPETDPSRAGYDFGGWYKDAAGNTKFYFNGENGAEEYDQNTTIYAKWESQPEYTRTFDLTASPGATVVLKLDGKTISQDSSSTATAVTYKLQRGTYTYTCSAKNYLLANRNTDDRRS